MTQEEAFYGLLLREEGSWRVRSVLRSGQRWEAVVARDRGRAIEAAAGATPYVALRTAWRRVEVRIGLGEMAADA